MKKNSVSTILFSLFHLIGIGLLGYLTLQHVKLKAGTLTGGSACNVSSLFNCDAVNASAYSEFLGIPISLWGALSLALALGLYLGSKLFHSAFSYAYAKLLTYFNLVVCLVYAGIAALLLNTHCLFCIGSYIAIAFSAIVIFFEEKSADIPSLKESFFALFKDQKFYLGLYAAIPVLAFVLNQASLGATYFEAKKNAKHLIQSWQLSPKKEIPDLSSYTLGSEDAFMTIKEFADFNCIHCKHASPVLHAFVKGHKGVQLKFYNFPLDGSCNPAIQRQGASCEMAKAVFCGHQLSDKGWLLQEKMFETKGALSRKESMDLVLNNSLVKKEDLKSCMESEATLNTIRAQAALGEKVGVRGTPSIYVNDKLLKGGQMLPVLKEAYQYLKSK